VNRGIVSVELEDGARPVDAQGRPTAPATAGQWSSLCWLFAYIHDNWLGQWGDTFDWHMHHRDLATKDCPFPRIYDQTAEYTRTIRAIMRHWNEAAPYHEADWVIAGKGLVLPETELAGLVTGGGSPGIRGFKGLWLGRG